MGDWCFQLLNRGRNFGVGIYFVTRRVQRISKDAFDLSQHVFFFRCGLKSRGYIEDMIGREETRKIMHLPLFHFLHYNVETEESSVHVLKLGRAIPEQEQKAKTAEEKDIKEGRLEEVRGEPKEGGEKAEKEDGVTEERRR